MSAITASTLQVPADEHVYLIGRPPMGEYLGFMKTQTVEGSAADVAMMAEQWRTAHERIKELEAGEVGAADDPPEADLPPGIDDRAAELLASPLVRRNFGITQNEVRMVELGRLVVYQKVINVGYARELQDALADPWTEDDLFDFCLPLDRRYDPPARVGPIQFGHIGSTAWAMFSPSTDYRVLETVLLDPSQVTGLDLNGAPTQIVAALIGYGTNYVSAMRVGSRLILRNGSHRAFAMRSAGITHAPVLIQNIPAGEEKELLPPEVEQHHDLFLNDPRPPLVRDYFDERLRLIVHVPRRTKQVRIGITYEESYIPGA